MRNCASPECAFALRGYRFYSYASDKDEPPHMHVECEAKKAKFWLDPIVAGPSSGFNRAELMKIYRLIAKHQVLSNAPAALPAAATTPNNALEPVN